MQLKFTLVIIPSMATGRGSSAAKSVCQAGGKGFGQGVKDPRKDHY